MLGVPIINKDYSILGSIVGSHYFGKLPFRPRQSAKLRGPGSVSCNHISRAELAA